MSKPVVWVVDDDSSIRWVVEKALCRADIRVISFDRADALLAQLSHTQPDTIISDIRMPGIDGMELLKRIHTTQPRIPVIITTAHSDLDSAVTAYEGGAFEYLPKPFDIEALTAVTQRAISHRLEQQKTASQTLDTVVSTAAETPEIIGESPAMQELFRAIGRLSNSHMTVLINGASGTGKELVARALHRHSPRRNREFVALNMAAIPGDLIESELFGHEKGAFTGASQRRTGRFEQADGGTLFLDEIGDMPAAAQTRLLRVLADGRFYRVGGHSSIKVDVRIITATHQNLEQQVASKRFRDDLFHRLNVIRLNLPTLSERSDDIIKLAEHFLQQAATELAVETKVLLPESQRFLQNQPWPGNVRQLENCCRWLTVMAPGREIHLQDLPAELLQEKNHLTVDQTTPQQTQGNDWEAHLQQWLEQQLASGQQKILADAQPRFEKNCHCSRVEVYWRTQTGSRKVTGLGKKYPDPKNKGTGNESIPLDACLHWGVFTLTKSSRLVDHVVIRPLSPGVKCLFHFFQYFRAGRVVPLYQQGKVVCQYLFGMEQVLGVAANLFIQTFHLIQRNQQWFTIHPLPLGDLTHHPSDRPAYPVQDTEKKRALPCDRNRGWRKSVALPNGFFRQFLF